MANEAYFYRQRSLLQCVLKQASLFYHKESFRNDSIPHYLHPYPYIGFWMY